MISVTNNSADQLLVQIPILLNHVSWKAMPLYSLGTVPVPVDTDIYFGNSHEYVQVHVQYPDITMSIDLYVLLMEIQLKLCTQMEVVKYF